MVERYAHLSPDHKRQAIKRLSAGDPPCSQPGVSQPLSAATAAT
jgi:hypothetical protein